MNILLTGFCGTSSELLVNKGIYKSIILPNDKIVDSRMLLEKINLKKYNYIFSFGQKPGIKNKLSFRNCVLTENEEINMPL